MEKYTAELFGTFWLVLAASFSEVGIRSIGRIAGIWGNCIDHGICD